MNSINELPSAPRKMTIDKNKLCDEYFDQLVKETSYSVTRRISDSDNEVTSASSSELNEDKNGSDPSSSSSLDLMHNRLHQPKRPMNAFMVWGQTIRRELHLKFSNVQNALLSKALGRVWRILSVTEKEPYLMKANQIKANHKRNYPDYRYQPRRVHDRRFKNSTLIGINLNHPVNQHQLPWPNSYTMGLSNYSNQFPQYNGGHHTLDKQLAVCSKSEPCSNNQDYDSDSMRPMEYRPYTALVQSEYQQSVGFSPIDQVESSLYAPELVVRQEGEQPPTLQNYQHHQPYQQFSYSNINPQIQYPNHQPSLSQYEDCYASNCNIPHSTINTDNNLYYSKH